MGRRLGCRLEGRRVRAIVGHGVVSTGAKTPALLGFQSPGDYATFNSNHIPDGTTEFAADSLLEEIGFEPVWGFSCQVVFCLLAVLCSERESRFSSRRLRSSSRS